jgi:hypothetical protein
VGACASPFLFTGDANALPELDTGHFSGKRIGLLIALARQFGSVGAGTSAARQTVAVRSHRRVNSKPDPGTDRGDANNDPACLTLGHSDLGFCRIGQCNKQGASCRICDEVDLGQSLPFCCVLDNR